MSELMTARERRGKRLYTIVASLVILHQFAILISAVSNGIGNIKLTDSVIVPLGLVFMMIVLRDGDHWVRWMLGAVSLAKGGASTYLAIRIGLVVWQVFPKAKHPEVREMVDGILGIYLLGGLFYLIVTAILFLSPSFKAFMRYQREGPMDVMITDDEYDDMLREAGTDSESDDSEPKTN